MDLGTGVSTNQSYAVEWTSTGTATLQVSAINLAGRFSDVATVTVIVSKDNANPDDGACYQNPFAGAPSLWNLTDGYLSGHNSFGDIAKAEFVEKPADKSMLDRIGFYFMAAEAETTPTPVTVKPRLCNRIPDERLNSK